jgi:hypothetical protein
MRHRHRRAPGDAALRGIGGLVLCAVALGAACGAGAAEGTASGSVTYQAKSGVLSATPRHAFLVKGPDAIDTSRVIRRLVFSASDLRAKIGACRSMSCADAELGEGMSVDLDSGPRLNYWVVFSDQKIQYSGTAPPAVLTLTTDTPARLSGKLSIDDSRAGGPRVDIEFDAPLIKEFR